MQKEKMKFRLENIVEEDVMTCSNYRGITIIALIITIIVMLILLGVSVTVALNGGIFNQAKKAVILQEVESIKEQMKLNSFDNEFTGKLSELNLNIDDNIIDKYNDILYVKNNELYLDFIANYPNLEAYTNNKEKIEILKNSMNICYDSLKTYNKLSNSSFDEGLENYKVTRNGNIIKVLNEDGNNYLHMELYLNSGNTGHIIQVATNAGSYGDKLYCFTKYRNNYVSSDKNNTINVNIADVQRRFGGYATTILTKWDFINSYGKGWKSASNIRTIEKEYGSDGLSTKFKLGGGEANLSTWEYSIDFDDLYIINLTEIFGSGNEPSKNEMDKIFKEF